MKNHEKIKKTNKYTQALKNILTERAAQRVDE